MLFFEDHLEQVLKLSVKISLFVFEHVLLISHFLNFIVSFLELNFISIFKLFRLVIEQLFKSDFFLTHSVVVIVDLLLKLIDFHFGLTFLA